MKRQFAMASEIGRNGIDTWSLPMGVVIGLGVLGYVYSLHGNHGEMIAFPLIFFPMLITIGVSAIAHIVFWLATGQIPRRNFPGALSNSELLSRAAQLSRGRWLVTSYHFMQLITMMGAGYITICPFIGILILK
jgi:hypothetical protein